MTTRRVNPNTSLFPQDVFSVGFNEFFKELGSPTKNNYPPFNIIRTGENAYLVEVAVAGFSEDDLEITLHNGLLKIVGESTEKHNTSDYIHKGMARRGFTRTFRVNKGVEVQDAQIYNGVLQVRMVRHIPEEEQPKKIPIGGNALSPFPTG